MYVEVLYFGAVADASGCRSETVKIEDGDTVGELIARVKQGRTGLVGLNLLSAVNERYSHADEKMRDGDTVALFTAVSGG